MDTPETPSGNRAGSRSPVRRVIIKHESTPVTNEADYLTLLAAQERKVMELKDDLKRAEQDLANLKRQWANHEATKRSREQRQIHRMERIPRPRVPTVSAEKDDTDGSSAWMYREMEHRKTLLGNNSSPARRIFSGSRHRKTLSLVPEPADHDQESGASAEVQSLQSNAPNGAIYHRRPTSLQPGHGTRGADSEPGKSLAMEWREGLWTFLEDLKQAAIGDDYEEARKGSTPKQAQSIEASKKWTGLIAKEDQRPKPEPKPKSNRKSLPPYGVNLEDVEKDYTQASSPTHSSNPSYSRSARSPSPPATTPATSATSTPEQPSRKADALRSPVSPASRGQSPRSRVMDEWQGETIVASPSTDRGNHGG